MEYNSRYLSFLIFFQDQLIKALIVINKKKITSMKTKLYPSENKIKKKKLKWIKMKSL